MHHLNLLILKKCYLAFSDFRYNLYATLTKWCRWWHSISSKRDSHALAWCNVSCLRNFSQINWATSIGTSNTRHNFSDITRQFYTPQKLCAKSFWQTKVSFSFFLCSSLDSPHKRSDEMYKISTDLHHGGVVVLWEERRVVIDVGERHFHGHSPRHLRPSTVHCDHLNVVLRGLQPIHH